MKVLVNDQLIERQAAKVDIEDRGYQFGDGIYEAIRVYEGKFFTLSEHLERLYASALKIELTIPYTPAELTALLQQLITANELTTGLVYFQITRGVQAPRNHVYLPKTRATLTATTMAMPRDPATFRQGIKTITVKDTRWLHCDIKSLNLLGNLLATNQAAKVNAQEAIFYRDADHVTECSHSNVALIQGGTLLTHPANELILNGITRQVILRIARKQGIPVEERPFSLAELKAADEVFVSSVAAEITAVGKVDETLIGDGTIGPISEKLLQGYVEEIEKECGIRVE